MKHLQGKMKKRTAGYITKVAILTAISYVLYWLGKFCSMPFLFPSFLEMQFSELPAILAGFSMGPLAGCLVIVLKCLLKMPFTTTVCVGELMDIVFGIGYVLPASLFYARHKTKKGAIVSLLIGVGTGTVLAMIFNRAVAVPFYVQLFFGGRFSVIVGLCSGLYPNINEENFYLYYIFVAVLPFNLLRLSVTSLITFLVYKKLSKVLHMEIKSVKKDKDGYYRSRSERDTFMIAEKFAESLKGGETVLLSGQLGAGKTTFTKGLCKALGVRDTVTSPTFTIMKTYRGKFTVHHLDMYRMESEDDVEELGLREEIGENDITVIEWNKFTDFVGKVYQITIEYDGDNARRIKIEEKK